MVWTVWTVCALSYVPPPKQNRRTVLVKAVDGALAATEVSDSVTNAHRSAALFDKPHLDAKPPNMWKSKGLNECIESNEGSSKFAWKAKFRIISLDSG